MPKRNPPKPKPDPLAKLCAPNLRRMVKRLRADERRLTRVCQSHHERYLQTLARVMELEKDRDRLAAEVERLRNVGEDFRCDAANLRRELAAVRFVAAQVTQVSEPLPDDARRWVVANVRDDDDYWTNSFLREAGWDYFTIWPQYRYAMEADGEPTGTTIIPDNTPAEVQVPPFGADTPPTSLPIADCFPWWYVFTPDVRLKPTTYLVAPVVADSLEGRAALLGVEAVKVCRRVTPTNESLMWTWGGKLRGDLCIFGPADVYPTPPATWRQA